MAAPASAAQQRRDHQRRPEADPAAALVGKIRAEHEHARVREVEHAHHAEDQREPDDSMNSSRP